jgi:hypothetical protein
MVIFKLLQGVFVKRKMQKCHAVVVYGALMSLFNVLMGNYKIADSLWS